MAIGFRQGGCAGELDAAVVTMATVGCDRPRIWRRLLISLVSAGFSIHCRHPESSRRQVKGKEWQRGALNLVRSQSMGSATVPGRP